MEPYRPVAPHRNHVDIWKEMVKESAAKGVDLQARFRGSVPNGAYACYGSAVAVVEVDCLNGEHAVEKFDCIYDAGEMLNVGTELGQVEGGLMMGLGWLKLEDLKWDQEAHPQVCLLNLTILNLIATRNMGIQSPNASRHSEKLFL